MGNLLQFPVQRAREQMERQAAIDAGHRKAQADYEVAKRRHRGKAWPKVSTCLFCPHITSCWAPCGATDTHPASLPPGSRDPGTEQGRAALRATYLTKEA